MKRLLIYIIGVALMTTACEFHTSDNGELDGFWQLLSVDTLATGGSKDLRYDQLSWSFQGHFVELRCPLLTIRANDVVARFSHQGDSLFLSDFYYSLRDSGDIKIETADSLYFYGIHHVDARYRILQLGGNRMTLQSDVLRLNLRRY